jgi:hypothetical protein
MNKKRIREGAKERKARGKIQTSSGRLLASPSLSLFSFNNEEAIKIKPQMLEQSTEQAREKY